MDAADIKLENAPRKSSQGDSHFLPEGLSLDEYERDIIREALRRADGKEKGDRRIFLGLQRTLRKSGPKNASVPFFSPFSPPFLPSGQSARVRLCGGTRLAAPNPAPIRVDCDQGAGFQVRATAVQRASDGLADGRREDVLRAYLEDARLSSLSFREKGAEIEIVSEDDQPVCTGIVHDLGVWRGWPANAGPVHAVETRIGQELDPRRAQVHVDQEFHAAGSGTSISSTRQAA
jgi:hypothetical protein